VGSGAICIGTNADAAEMREVRRRVEVVELCILVARADVEGREWLSAAGFDEFEES